MTNQLSGEELMSMWDKARTGQSVQAKWYPDPCPRFDNETDDAFTNRLSRHGSTNPYNHKRFRECSLGYHLTCSCNHGRNSGCECPHHNEKEYESTADISIELAASTLADLYYLPITTAQQVILASIDSIVKSANEHQLRVALCEEFQSPIGPWFVTDILTILKEYLDKGER